MARQSISRVFAELARKDPDRVMLTSLQPGSGSTQMTAGDMERRAAHWVHGLLELGVQRNDLVQISLPNGMDFAVACIAVWKAGATPQPISPQLSEVEAWSLSELVARHNGGPAVLLDASAVADLEARVSADGTPELSDAWADSWKAPATSGSTGNPKIVQAAAPALIDPSQGIAEFLPEQATQLVSGPLWHSAVFTYAFRGLMTGHRLVILPRFDEREWLRAVEQYQVTWTLLVPTTMRRMMRLAPEELDPRRVRSLQAVLHLGAPCPPDLKRQFLGWLGPERVLEVYAGSESNGLTLIRGHDWLQHPGSVGRPIGSTEIEIRDEQGAALVPGKTGMIWMRRGDSAAYRYLGAQSHCDDHGWDTLGDVGWVDDEGWLYLRDRADDVINRGGEKIWPTEIEAVLEQHPAVRSAMAYAVPHEEYGHAPTAVADIAESDVSAETLRRHVYEVLGSARTPLVVKLVREPVRNDAGKVRRPRE